jgi:nucleotide-binding universal stress UspA family protein
MSDVTPDKGGAIVVGVDGSDCSKAALVWAVRQARLTGAKLRVMMAWHMPTMVYGPGMVFPPAVESMQDAQKLLEEEIVGVVGANSPISFSATVVEGSAAQVLLDEANDAALLVVGSRGHGGFAGMLLGSVSQHCVSHARCPVAVVKCLNPHS